MLGRHTKQPAIFHMTPLDDLIPENHCLRRLDAAIDFGFVRDEVAPLYAEGGRPSVDPELVLRMLLIGYLFDLSEKRLCDEIRMHVGYRWFCGLTLDDPVPDRTTLVKLRTQRWGPEGVFDRVFVHVVKACEDAGLIRGKNVGIDGTQVEANAAITSLEAIAQPQESPITYLQRFEEPSDAAATSEDPPDDPPKPPKQAAGDGRRKAGDPDFRGQRWSNATHRSKSDPDARLYRKSGGQGARLSYLAHYLSDIDTRVILDYKATLAHGTAEREAAQGMLDRSLAQPWGQRVKRCMMDAGYRDGALLAEVIARGIDPIVPMGSLQPEEVPRWKRRTRKLHIARQRRRKVKVSLARNRARELNRSPAYGKLQRQRIVSEHLFGEAKVCHGLRRARGRGLSPMAVQTALTATAQNLKRLVYYRGKRRQPAAAAAAAPGRCTQAHTGGRRGLCTLTETLHHMAAPTLGTLLRSACYAFGSLQHQRPHSSHAF